MLSYMGLVTMLDDGSYVFRGFELNYYKNTINAYIFTQKYADLLSDIGLFLRSTNGKIYNLDYKAILSKAKANDFVFLDPPYIEDHKYKFKYNNDEKLDIKFLKSLKSKVRKLDKKGVKWLMTQADTKEIRELFKEYDIIEYPVYRISRKTYTTELIIKNY